MQESDFSKEAIFKDYINSTASVVETMIELLEKSSNIDEKYKAHVRKWVEKKESEKSNENLRRNKMKIYNTSPHDTKHEHGVWEGHQEPDLTLTDTSKKVENHPFPGIELMLFGKEISEKCANRLKKLAQEYDLVLLPAMFSAVSHENWIEHDIPKKKFVAYIATSETQRAKPQDKVACSNKFSLIW